MTPPYTITPAILHLLTQVAQKLGEVKAMLPIKQSPELRKRNRIKSIHASLAVEGNTLDISQVTAILDNKRVIGPAKDIIEVKNAIKVYEMLKSLDAEKEQSFLKAHALLMESLVPDPGKYRKSGAGIVKGKQLAHVAPPASNVPFLMKDLFRYLKRSGDPLLIKSCVFHYELEFIHPFSDGNGRMGRLWQTLILMKEFPVFEFLPFETLISMNQKSYYGALSASDKEGSSTRFIEFMLAILEASLAEILKERMKPLSNKDRIDVFLSGGVVEFTRKEYMTFHRSISPATASRDLKTAVDMKLVKKKGDKNNTVYRKL